MKVHETKSDSKSDIAEQIYTLRELIEQHNYHYYIEDSPKITDQAFDKLFSELKKLENDYPDLITPDSPTQRVGAKPLDKFSTITHAEPMLSLENVFDDHELKKFDERIKERLKSSVNVN